MVIAAAGAVVYRRNRGFLLLKKRHYWEFPKGRVDPSDTDLAATARREVSEETGLTVTRVLPGFLAEETYRVKGERKSVTYYLFVVGGEPAVSSEHRGYAWCTAQEAMRLLTYESKRQILRKAVAFLRAKNLET